MATPTFSKDVAPIVYGRCASCHRPGEAAPMSLLSCEEVRPWARSIKDVVVSIDGGSWSGTGSDDMTSGVFFRAA